MAASVIMSSNQKYTMVYEFLQLALDVTVYKLKSSMANCINAL